MTFSAAPTVLLSRDALAKNARTLLSGGGTVDLRFEAMGHGATEAAPVVRAAGATALIADRAHADELRAFGVPVHTEGRPDVDSRDLFGIPHGTEPSPFEPVMALAGVVLSTKPLLAGEAVSYGYTHRAPSDTVVALVTGGYAQGIIRSLGNRADVLIDGQLRPIVGRIAMDVCVVDLQGTDVPIGASVGYFGGHDALRDALARWSQLCGLTPTEIAAVIGQNGQRKWTA